jgi:glycosyltransferase involved in cell wall biosynthesis
VRIAHREAAEVLAAAGVGDRVELVGTFTQREAPALYHRADLLVHPHYNDVCPTVVLEAMASGLPVVFSASGGTPELVGGGGLGVPAPEDFEHDHPPEPEALARAILQAAERRDDLAAAARQRAVDHFDLKPWIEHHRRLFAKLTS